MELLDILAVGVVIGFAALIQSAVGFGFLLFATPLILWIGFGLPEVVTLVSTCSTVQAALGARHLRASVPWRLTLTATVVRLIAVVIGLFLLTKIVKLDVNYIKLVVGSIVGLIVIAKLLLQPQPVEKLHWGWAGFTFVVSGLLSGICGIGGPPLVLWAIAQNWATNKVRAFLFAVLAISTPIQIILLIQLGPKLGVELFKYVVIGIAFFPVAYLGYAVGLPIGDRMRKRRHRLIADIILLLVGASTVFGAVISKWH